MIHELTEKSIKDDQNKNEAAKFELLKKRISEYINYVEKNIEERSRKHELLNNLLDKNEDLRNKIINLKNILENPVFLRDKLETSDYEDEVGNFVYCMILNFNRIAQGKEIHDSGGQKYDINKLIGVLEEKVEEFYSKFGIEYRKAA